MCVRACVCVCVWRDVASQRQAPGRAWISFRKVSKVYTLFALISMFIRQRKIAGRDHKGGGGRRGERWGERDWVWGRGGGCGGVPYRKDQ